MTFEQVPDEATHIGFWLYAKDFILKDRLHPSWALQGMAYMPLKQHMPDGHVISLAEMADNNGQIVVGEIRLESLIVTPPVKSTEFVLSESIDMYANQIKLELFDRNIHQNALIMDKGKLPRWRDSLVALPVPVSDKMVRYLVPMWLYTWLAYEHRTSEKDKAAVDHYLRLAMARLQNNTSKQSIDDWGEAEWMQVACEAAALVPLALEYRPDHVGDRSIEQFSWIAHHSPLSLPGAGIDCEDAAEHCLRVILHMQHSLPPSPLRQLLEQYEFFFAIVTLDSDGHMQYHAVVLGLDKKWVSSQVDAGNNFVSYIPEHRAVLIEGTDYVTAHYGFQQNLDAAADRAMYDKNPLCENVHFHTRIPSICLSDTKQYHHLILACTPQWITDDSKRIGEIAFCDDQGRLGVPLTSLLEHDEETYKSTRVRVPSPQARVTPNMLADARRYLGYLPEYNPLPRPSVIQENTRSLPRGSSSWTQDPQVFKEFSKTTPGISQIVAQNISDQLCVQGLCFN